MTPDPVLARLQAADPARDLRPDDPAGLYRQVVATPGDARLAAGWRRGSQSRKPWLRVALHPVGVLVGLVIVAGAAAATTGVLGLGQFVHASPRQLFIANPGRWFPHSPDQVVVPSSVRRAVTFTVPGDGRFEYWIALSRKGWLCEAIRQPDGSWADLPHPGDRYELSGPVPGCEGTSWHDPAGFSYYPTSTGTTAGAWRIVYGYAPSVGDPVTVRDRISGATARIGDGRYFAIVIRLCRGAGCVRRLRWPRPFQFETLDGAGRVLVRDARDPGM